jgi:hypothetical protein
MIKTSLDYLTLPDIDAVEYAFLHQSYALNIKIAWTLPGKRYREGCPFSG